MLGQLLERVAKRRSFVHRPGSLLWICMALSALIAGCDSSRLEQMENKVNEVQKNLYAPSDAVLLTSRLSGGHKPYTHPDCFGVVTWYYYGVNRPVHQVITAYFSELTQNGWKPDPNVKQNITNEFTFLRKGPQIRLAIYADNPKDRPLITIDLGSRQFTTIYVVQISYFEPSSDDCRV